MLILRICRYINTYPTVDDCLFTRHSHLDSVTRSVNTKLILNLLLQFVKDKWVKTVRMPPAQERLSTESVQVTNESHIPLL